MPCQWRAMDGRRAASGGRFRAAGKPASIGD
jgi:hypothetical protein